MRKIIVNLTHRWDFSALADTGSIDVILYPAGRAVPSAMASRCEAISTDGADLETLARELWLPIDQLDDSVAKGDLVSFINDYFSYSLVPAAAALASLQKARLRFPDAQVVILATRSRSRVLPLLGFRTLESSRDSPNLLHSRYAHILLESDGTGRAIIYYCRGDLLHIESLRCALLRLAGLCFSLLWIFRALFLTFWGTQARSAGFKLSVLAVVRVAHQARFAMRLSSGDRVGVAVLPQATRGSLFQLWRVRATFLKHGIPVICPSAVEVLRACIEAVRRSRSLKRTLSEVRPTIIKLPAGKIPLNLRDLMGEIRLAVVALFHAETVKLLLQRQNADLLSFEMVGRFAGLEAAAARSAGVRSTAIQTVLLQHRPLPIFPLVDRFFADGASTVRKLRGIGARSAGNIAFAGPPYPVTQIGDAKAFRRIGYYTQPYETSVNKSILHTLIEWSRENGANITLRMHPRDKLNNYLKIISGARDVLSIDSGLSLEESITSHDVVVTRTSSVAKEALALGKPIILCLWTDIDRAVKADYIEERGATTYHTAGPAHLRRVLSDFQRTTLDARRLHEKLFNGYSLDNLKVRISE